MWTNSKRRTVGFAILWWFRELPGEPSCEE